MNTHILQNTRYLKKLLSTVGVYHCTICTVILLFQWFELKELVSVEDEPSAPLRWEGKNPQMLKNLGLMENRFGGAKIEKPSN